MNVYGLPLPNNPQSELDYYHQKHCLADESALFNQLVKDEPMTQEQSIVFNHIVQAVCGGNVQDVGNCVGRLFMLLASAGCGKTSVARKVAAYCRSQGHVVLICASTAIAALNYPNDGTTAHSLFGVPVIEDYDRDLDDDPLECVMSKERYCVILIFYIILYLLFFVIFC